MRRKKKKYKNRNDTSSKGRKTAAKRRTAAPKTRNMNVWSESEYYQRIRASLRRAFRFWRPMQEALRIASRPSQSTNKRLKTEYQCAHCKNWFKRADVQVDHIEECGSLSKPEDIAPFLERLTREDINAYQILCKSRCHPIKTKKYLEEKKKLKK